MKIIITESQLEFLEESHKNEFGAFMLNLRIPNWNRILDSIDKLDLYVDKVGYGLELKPHCTILFGLHGDASVNKIKYLVKNAIHGPIGLTLNGISIFPSRGSSIPYDVVKFDVIPPTLHKLNHIIKSNFKHSSNFLDYNPHVTIAYVKAGMGKKYINPNIRLNISSDDFYYSPAMGQKTLFTI